MSAAHIMSGTPLNQLRRPNAVDVISILRKIAYALDEAHRAGRVHGSLTPADITIDEEPDRSVQIANFGTPKLNAADLTSPERPGEPSHYIAREQVLGTRTDERVDEYALAVIAYELLTGRKPFLADTLSALLYEICARDPEPANQVNDSVSPAAAEVLRRALAKNPEERFASCSEFVNALAAALDLKADSAPAVHKQVAFAAAAQGAPSVQTSSARTSSASAQTGRILAPAPPPLFDLPAARAPRRWYDESDETKPLARSGSPVMRFGVIAALAIFAVGLLVFLFRPNTRPSIPTQILDSNTGPASPPPADAAAPAPKQPPTVEQTVPPKPNTATPAAPKSNAEAQSAGGPVSASVDMISEPPGARIVIDNRPEAACTAPCTLSLPNGRHTLSAQLTGYSTARRIFKVPDDRDVVIALGQPSGTLLLTSVPSGSTIVIDGRPYGQTPATVHLAPGTHQLQLRNGDRTHDEMIQVEADSLASRNFTWQQ